MLVAATADGFLACGAFFFLERLEEMEGNATANATTAITAGAGSAFSGGTIAALHTGRDVHCATARDDAQAFFTDNPVDIGFGPGGRRNCRTGLRSDGKPNLQRLSVRLCLWVGYGFGCSWPHRRCWLAGADLGEWWPSRLVATAAEDGLS
jgi:hypothetical protein